MDETIFDDPGDYKDDIPDDVLLADVLRKGPTEEECAKNLTIVTGLPVVQGDRVEKLKAVVKKVFDRIGENEPIFPLNEDGSSKGAAFVDWKSIEAAHHAKTVLDGYRFDKNHTFVVTPIEDANRLQRPCSEWSPPKPAPFVDVGSLWDWMEDARCSDHYAVQSEKNGVPTVAVYRYKRGQEPEPAGDSTKTERPNWTESIFRWSPHGSYLLTIHSPGTIAWGGVEFARFQRFPHHGVEYVQFSPQERYLVTFAPPTKKWAEDEDSIRIWDVRTGEMKKAFSLYGLTGHNELPTWPLLKWSHDEKFVGCLKTPEKDELEREQRINGIAVFDTETFKRRHIIIENINMFEWSPTDNVIAYYCECSDTVPAEFGLMNVQNQNKLRSGRIYNVADARMFWQANGKRLAVHSKRYTKKTTNADTGEIKYIGGCAHHLDIFEMDKKDVSMMNLPLPEPFINFAWEPNGDKFAVLTGTDNKATPHVYKIDSKSPNPLKIMSKLDAGVQFNELQWAPCGQWLAVLAKLSAGGNVMFVDTTLAEAKRTNVVEHPGFNKGCWDPTGRYFVTCSTLGGRLGADLGFRIYTFQGRELCRKGLERLSQFQWRPRPPVKLTDQKLREIKKNLKKTAVRFEREDNEEKNQVSHEVVEKRRKIMSEFNLVRERNLKEIAARHADAIELRSGAGTKTKEDLVDEEIMFPLSTKKTLAAPADDVD